METFLEYFGAKLATAQKSMAPKHSPFQTDGNIRKSGGGIADPNMGKLIAKSRNHDATLHPKVEKIRQGQSTLEVLNNMDLQQITKEYGISDLDETHPKTLSNMAISIVFNPQLKAYTLIKNG